MAGRPRCEMAAGTGTGMKGSRARRQDKWRSSERIRGSGAAAPHAGEEQRLPGCIPFQLSAGRPHSAANGRAAVPPAALKATA